MRSLLNPDGNRKFLKEEFLTAVQITSFWSRYASRTRERAASARKEALAESSVHYTDVPQDEFQKDSYLSEDQQMRDIFQEEINNAPV